MKKIKLLIILSIFILTFAKANFAYALQKTLDSTLQTSIGSQAIDAPLTLPVWVMPSSEAAAVVVSQVKNLNILRNIIAPVFSGSNLVKNSKDNLNIGKDKQIFPANNDLAGIGNEEILYNIDFIDSKETPIYPDTIILIKIPDNIKYSENSVKLNNQKLTDEEDKDRLTFLREDNTLKIILKGLNKNKRITIAFGAKPLVSNISANSPYCLIKFQSKAQKSNHEWKPFSAL